MEYRPEDDDALPVGYWEATPAEQEAYWDSRAQHMYERDQRRLTAIEISQDSAKRLMAEFFQVVREGRERRKRQASCQHVRTIRVAHAADEYRDVALDPEVELSCRDCGVALEVVA